MIKISPVTIQVSEGEGAPAFCTVVVNLENGQLVFKAPSLAGGELKVEGDKKSKLTSIIAALTIVRDMLGSHASLPTAAAPAKTA